MSYNGWANYETWCVGLWLYDMAREIANNGESLWKRKEAFKDLIEDMNPLANTCTMFTDLLNAAISEIDWLEIVEHYLDED
jgi:hypothetical protein